MSNDMREALKQILGWRELRSRTNEFPIERIEDIARKALNNQQSQQAQGEPMAWAANNGSVMSAWRREKCLELSGSLSRSAAKFNTPLYPPAPAAVPQSQQAQGESVRIQQYPEWPTVGFDYLVRFDGVWQFKTYRFDQGDDGVGGGEYFWDRDDVDEGRLFDPHHDAWINPSEIGAIPAPAAVPEVVRQVLESAFGELTEAYNKGFVGGTCRGRIRKILDTTPAPAEPEGVRLTRQTAQELLEASNDYCDEGPTGYGWKSDRLSKAVAELEAQLAKASDATIDDQQAALFHQHNGAED